MTAARAVARRAASQRASRALVLALSLASMVLAFAAFAALSAASASAATPLTGVDLSTYVRVGRYDLPEPTRTTAPAGSLLAQEASSVTYDWDTDTLFVVGDGGTSVVQVSKTGQLINSMTLAAGSSPQGTEFYDTEGITYVGNGRFVITEERYRQVDEFTYVANTTLTRANAQTVKLGTTIGNIGLEGITNDPYSGGFVVVKEKQPESIFQTGIDFAAGTATNGSATTDESTNLFDPSLAGVLDFSDVFSLSNLSTLTGPDTSHLLVISQESGRILNIDRTGVVSSSLTIVGDSDNPLSVPDQTHEGVTMDNDGNLYDVSEDGGGDATHPQMWVYAPSTRPDLAPTAVTLGNQITTLPEHTSTATRLKVADVTVADDGLGENNLTVTGPDAADFEVDSNGLYIKAGTDLDFQAKRTYDVSVAVDDPAVGTTPDATSAPYTLTLTADPDQDSGPPSVIVSEVSPTGSSNTTYRADWFELTNTGTHSVDLTGWKMDDNSNDFNDAVPLAGVSSLAPGQSAVFVETETTPTRTTTDAFEAAWFGSNVPVGFTIGTYGGSGVGLSSGGDEVNIFDTLGDRVTGVTFGTSTTGVSFDNSAGLGDTTATPPTISTLSATGTNGAFASATGGETGSPGTSGTPSAVITEVSPTGSSTATYQADWWEVTNTGSTSLDLTGWKMDDNSDALSTAVALNGVTSIAPGKSAVFIEGTAATARSFTDTWFGTGKVPAGFQIGSYSGSGVGLSASGDAVNLFDSFGNPVTGVSFGAATTGVSFDNSSGTPTAPTTLTTLSADGTDGAFVSPTGEIGSPGSTADAVAISEVAPWGSSTTTYAADWWEVTNTGGTPLDLGGWKMDDSSDALSTAVALNGVRTIPAGQSAIFIEGDGTNERAFTDAWFGSGNLPAGFQIGNYSGSSVSLSTGGDGVNLFDALGNHVTGVSFGASTTGVSFDNAAGLGVGSGTPPTISTLSAIGVNGAFLSATGETGSPGTIAPDVTAPTITYTGNAGVYTADQQVDIRCAATDEAYGSGIASTTCADVTGLAGSFGLGRHEIDVTATDHAGNVGTGKVTFTVLETPPSGPTDTGTGTTPPPTDTGTGTTPPPTDTGTTTTPTPPPTVTPPPVTSTPPVTTLKPKPATTPKPTLALGAKSAKVPALVKGLATRLTRLKAKSKVVLTVRVGGKTLTTVTGRADKLGKLTIKLKLTRKQLAKLHEKKLTLRYKVVTAAGKTTTLTATLKVA